MSSQYDEVMAKKSFLPYRIGYLTDWMIEKAREELNETEQNRGTALEEFRSLVKKDSELNCWTDDAYLLQFLRVRKFNIEHAMERLQNLYSIKKSSPDVYPETLDVDNLRRFFETDVASCLPYRDKDGAVVVIFKIANWDPDLYPTPVAVSLMTATVLCTVEDPATQICGVQIIIDMENASLKQITNITPRYLKLFSYALRNTLPVRFKMIHIFNENVLFTSLYNILKIFLTEKIKKRFHFHGTNAKHLQKYVPKEILPPEYGGDNIHYNAKEWLQKEMEAFYGRYAEMHLNGYC